MAKDDKQFWCIPVALPFPYATNIKLPAMRDPVPTANQPNVAGAAMLNQMSPFVLAVMVKVKLMLLSTWAKVADGEMSLVGVSPAASAVTVSTTRSSLI